MWTQAQGLALVRDIFEALEHVVPVYPALTGGLVYKDGTRKDCDVVLYMNRQRNLTPKLKVIEELEHVPGLQFVKDCGFVTKWKYMGKPVDIMFPEWYVSGVDDYEGHR